MERGLRPPYLIMHDILWLPNRLLKGIEISKIIYEEYTGQDYGGYYTHGSNKLVVCDEEENIPATIAHEFCHYLQYFNGKLSKGSIWPEGDNYEQSIHSYFDKY